MENICGYITQMIEERACYPNAPDSFRLQFPSNCLKHQGADIDSQRLQINKDLTPEFGLHVIPERSDGFPQSLNATSVGLVSQVANSRYKAVLEYQQSLGEHPLASVQEFFCLLLRTS